ncbi:MAG: methionine synthase, partial [Eubacterium sp.]|nr:methionine synthase [Eubacterium sp.]
DCEMKDSGFSLEGDTVKEHLDGCNKCVCFCTTLGGEVDALIRKKQITSMAEAMMIDKMASFLVEKACDKAEEIIMNSFEGCKKTDRYGLGYGDFPITKQKEFLDMLDAGRQVGVHVNDASMLMPTKSVTCLIGIKNDE